MPTTTPAFMSKTPGPGARPPSSRQGISARVPTGQTVSRWPRSSVPPSRKTTEARRASPRGAQGRSSAGTPRSRRRSWTQAASLRDAGGVLARALEAHERLEVADQARQVRLERREPAGDMGDNLSPRTGGGGCGSRTAATSRRACRGWLALGLVGPPSRPTRGPASSASRRCGPSPSCARPPARRRRRSRPAPSGPSSSWSSRRSTRRSGSTSATPPPTTSSRRPSTTEARAFLQRPAAEALAARAPRPAGDGLRPPGPRRLPAVVGDEGLLGRHPAGQARVRRRSREGLPPQPRLRRRPHALPAGRRQGGRDAEPLRRDDASGRTPATRAAPPDERRAARPAALRHGEARASPSSSRSGGTSTTATGASTRSSTCPSTPSASGTRPATDARGRWQGRGPRGIRGVRGRRDPLDEGGSGAPQRAHALPRR